MALWGCDRQPAQTAESHIPAGLESRFYPPPGWSWGRLRVAGAPPVRYGVAAPSKAVRAQVLILPDAGEPAEAWFETAADLMERNYLVWMIDWPGQGGSGRWRGAPDRTYTPSMDLDLAALRAMVGEVVRPGAGAPLVLVGDGLGAQLALRALSQGLPGAAGAVLGDPMLKHRPGPAGADWAARLGLGRVLAPGEQGWRDGDASGRDRGAVGQAWMRANPELRAGGASLGWVAAYNRSAEAARDPQALGRIGVPVLVLARPSAASEARRACWAIRGCRFKPLAVEGPAPHLAADPVRGRWLAETAGFIESRARGHAVASAP